MYSLVRRLDTETNAEALIKNIYCSCTNAYIICNYKQVFISESIQIYCVCEQSELILLKTITFSLF